MNVFLIAAVSLDGYIAQSEGQISTAWTSAEDKKWFNQRTKDAGVIVMGRTTYETVGRPLPGRKNIVLSSQVKSTPEQPWVEKDGVFWSSLSPAELIAAVEKEGFSELAVCGGASVYRQFLDENVLTELQITLEPVALGTGVPLFRQSQSTDVKRFTLKSSRQLNDQGSMLLTYSRV
jgi:dihydrofolate reductase